MRLGLRLFFAFFLVTGLTAFFLLRVFMEEVKPSVREVMEDLMVDTAQLVATMAGPDPADPRLAARLRPYAERHVDARIWGLRKTTVDLRITITDARGIVLLDTGSPSEVGQDHSRWNDVLKTLRGEYGARATRLQAADDRSTVMVVAAPVLGVDGKRVGVVSISKPLATVEGFVGRAQRRIFWFGVLLLGLSLAIGVAVTLWFVHNVRQLRRYASTVQGGQRGVAPPDVPGELGELADAMDAMRRRLDGREHIEHTVRALTHELKSPLAAMRGAGELLQEPLDEPDRQRFAAQVVEQSERMRELVDRMLELSKLEMLEGPPHPERLRLDAVLDGVLAAVSGRLAQQRLTLSWLRREPVEAMADRELLALAFANLLGNAIDFAPPGSALELALDADGAFSLRDHGPGVPPSAWAHLGERFFSTARPGTAIKGSGLGLAIVRQVAVLHGGALDFEPAQPGLRVRLRLPPA